MKTLLHRAKIAYKKRTGTLTGTLKTFPSDLTCEHHPTRTAEYYLVYDEEVQFADAGDRV